MKLDRPILVKKAHYLKLLERFDVGRAVADGEMYEIDITCPMCEEFGGCVDCKGCPFTGRYGDLGCYDFIEAATGFDPRDDYAEVHLGVFTVGWNEEDDAKARAIIRKIRKAIVVNLTYRGKPRREG